MVLIIFTPKGRVKVLSNLQAGWLGWHPEYSQEEVILIMTESCTILGCGLGLGREESLFTDKESW